MSRYTIRSLPLTIFSYAGTMNNVSAYIRVTETGEVKSLYITPSTLARPGEEECPWF